MGGINVSRWLTGGLAAGILIWLMEGAASALYMSAMIDALEPHGLAVDTSSAAFASNGSRPANSPSRRTS